MVAQPATSSRMPIILRVSGWHSSRWVRRRASCSRLPLLIDPPLQWRCPAHCPPAEGAPDDSSCFRPCGGDTATRVCRRHFGRPSGTTSNDAAGVDNGVGALGVEPVRRDRARRDRLRRPLGPREARRRGHPRRLDRCRCVCRGDRVGTRDEGDRRAWAGGGRWRRPGGCRASGIASRPPRPRPGSRRASPSRRRRPRASATSRKYGLLPPSTRASVVPRMRWRRVGTRTTIPRTTPR